MTTDLDRVPRFDDGAPRCTCGGNGICVSCVLDELERDADAGRYRYDPRLKPGERIDLGTGELVYSAHFLTAPLEPAGGDE